MKHALVSSAYALVVLSLAANDNSKHQLTEASLKELTIGVTHKGDLYALDRGSACPRTQFVLDATFQLTKPEVIGDLVIWRYPLGRAKGESTLVKYIQRCHWLIPFSSRPQFSIIDAQSWVYEGQDSVGFGYRLPPKHLQDLACPLTDNWETLSEARRAQLEHVSLQSGFVRYTVQPYFSEYWDERAKVDEAVRNTKTHINRSATLLLPDGSACPAPPTAFTNMLPYAEDRYLLVLAWENKLRMWDYKLASWRGDAELASGPDKLGVYKPVDDSIWKVKSKPDYEIPSTWMEPFVAFGKPPALSFVTFSGRVHAWRNAGKADQVLQRVWDGPAIEAIVSDADTNRVWVFSAHGKQSNKIGRFFFLLDPGHDNGWDFLTQYELPSVKSDGLPAKVAQVLPYVRVLQNHKKL